MNTQYNSSTGKTTWSIDTWYEKTAYVVGVIFSIIMLVSFSIGFFGELLK